MKDKKIKLRYKLLNFDITPVACQSPEKYVELLKKILDDLNSATLLIVSGHCGQNRPECDFSCSNRLFAIS